MVMVEVGILVVLYALYHYTHSCTQADKTLWRSNSENTETSVHGRTGYHGQTYSRASSSRVLPCQSFALMLALTLLTRYFMMSNLPILK